MYKKVFFIALIGLFSFNSAWAQLQRIMHQSFEADSAESINLDLYGDYEVEFWSGNTILCETTIVLYDASPAILKHFVEVSKRYDVTNKLSGTTLHIAALDKIRKPVRSKNGECKEEIELKLYIPESFKASTEGLVYLRKQEEN